MIITFYECQYNTAEPFQPLKQMLTSEDEIFTTEKGDGKDRVNVTQSGMHNSLYVSNLICVCKCLCVCVHFLRYATNVKN